MFGLPNEEYGEEVRAVVQLAVPDTAGEEVADALKAHCRAALGPLKVPRQIDFTTELPRHATGKLYKQALRERYLQEAARRGG